MANPGKTLLIGSCFSSNIGSRMIEEGRDVLVNPFGTIFNPASIAASLERLENPKPFTQKDCVMMGAGAGLWASFNHYTKFAKPTTEEFLSDANASLEESAQYYKECSRIIITFGTAWCWRHKATDEDCALLRSIYPHKAKIVSNCLKIPEREFSRERLDPDRIFIMYSDWLGRTDKEVIFTVSPIRHLMDGEHENTLSKAILHLAIDKLMHFAKAGGRKDYFPAYEILIDTLRDHKWYARDDVHPSEEAIDSVWRTFKEWEQRKEKSYEKF